MLDRARADVLKNNWPADQEEPITIVVLPEFVARHWWERLLYNQAGRCLKAVIADVPYGRER